MDDLYKLERQRIETTWGKDIDEHLEMLIAIQGDSVHSQLGWGSCNKPRSLEQI